MDAIILQVLNGLDKGSAYALIALGLTLIFGTLGVVNFAHGALFMLGAFCAVTLNELLRFSTETVDPSRTDFLGNPLKKELLIFLDRWAVDLVDLREFPNHLAKCRRFTRLEVYRPAERVPAWPRDCSSARAVHDDL